MVDESRSCRRRRHRRGRILGAIGLAVSTCVAALVVPAAGSIDASPAAAAINLSTPGPLGPVSIVGDSVLLGSALTSPTLPDQLVANGWGPIRFQAIGGLSSGHFNVPFGAKATHWIGYWRSLGWDAPTVVVNIGANDSGLCQASVQCARDSVMHLVDAIGPGHQIWWPQATGEPRHAWRVAVWNATLAQVAAEVPNLHTWDWPTVMATEGYRSHDGVHLDGVGYRKRSARMAQQITADVGRASRTGGDEPLPIPTAASSRYDPVAPVRIVDTRGDPPGRQRAGSTMRVDFGDHLPPEATAVAVNVTAAEPIGVGYLAAHPCGRPGPGSTVNYNGRSRGAMTITPLDAKGDICIYAETATDIVVDLQGAFVDPAGGAGLGFDPYATPERLADTRETGRRAVVSVPTPPGVDAVAINITAVDATIGGFVRAYPCDDTTSGVSNVNYGSSEVVAGGAFVPVSATDTICLYSSTSVDVIVDITGTFSSGAALSFLPSESTRMLDTRDGTGGWSPIHGGGQTLDVRVAPTGARAVTGTLTMIRPFIRGFLTGYGCGGRPATSSANAAPGIVLANSITTGVSASGRLCIYASQSTNTLFDTTGWWVP